MSLLKDTAYIELIREEYRKAREEKEEFENRKEWWDWVKTVIRMTTVEYSREKARSQEEMMELRKEYCELQSEVAFALDMVGSRLRLREVEEELEAEWEKKAEGYRVRARVPKFEQKEPSKELKPNYR